MEIETDHAEVKVQIGVGFRVCKECGETFAKVAKDYARCFA